MKSAIFDQYVDKIIELFSIKREDFFLKSKKQELVDARQLFYYLCYTRNIRLCYIERYMISQGYNIGHNSIQGGVKSMEKKIEQDPDQLTIVKKIDKSVLI
jgi:chromosomal replication initiation ATPase DnaA